MSNVTANDPACVENTKEIWRCMEMLDGIAASMDRTIEILKDNLAPICREDSNKSPAIEKGLKVPPEWKTQLGARLSGHYACLDTLELSLEDLVSRLEI